MNHITLKKIIRIDGFDPDDIDSKDANIPFIQIFRLLYMRIERRVFGQYL